MAATMIENAATAAASLPNKVADDRGLAMLLACFPGLAASFPDQGNSTIG